MFKKIVALGVMVVMVFSLVALTGCSKKGIFYSLQEAYDEGLLTKEDLQSIASYENASPRLGHPEPLNDKVAKAIKETVAADLRAQTDTDGTLLYPNASSKEVRIVCYYGTYGDCVAVMLTDGYHGHVTDGKTETIAGVDIHYSGGNSIRIWKPN